MQAVTLNHQVNPPMRPEGLEPPTIGSEDRRSVQLSYRRGTALKVNYVYTRYQRDSNPLQFDSYEAYRNRTGLVSSVTGKRPTLCPTPQLSYGIKQSSAPDLNRDDAFAPNEVTYPISPALGKTYRVGVEPTMGISPNGLTVRRRRPLGNRYTC
jgi:hypothetical protein